MNALSFTRKEIYGVRNSGWKSPEWNWGYAVGTGHDCARICRQMYNNRESREELIANLLESGEQPRIPENFEEIKLILALAWQRGRWDGSDGGRGGYGDVLQAMADAIRYEEGTEDECSMRLVEDMQSRFHLLKPQPDESEAMQRLLNDCVFDLDLSRRRCSGLVLQSMGFVENGI
jgi:hypothetical protein